MFVKYLSERVIMGVDILDIVFHIEKKYYITIDRSDLIPDEVLGQKNIDEYLDRFTVKFLCDLVEQKIREKNKEINSFPNVLQEVGNSVRETFSKQFNIPDTTKITNELSLEQLANLSASPIHAGFWRQLRKRRKDDTDELKMIKSYLISREYVSVFKTLALSFVITFAFFVWLFISDWEGVNVLKILAALFVPSCVLFGIRAIVNLTKSRSGSKITVAEMINYIVDQKRDHSVRTDGQPYSRKEIEQDIAEILCDCLALKPEKITPDARIVKDLGAE
jgi:acyl carrier protein